MSWKKDLESLASTPKEINNLASLFKSDWGFSHVAQVLAKFYESKGFNAEGLFPTFRVKVSPTEVQILSLAPETKFKLLLNQPYVADRYDKQIVRLGSIVGEEHQVVLIPYSIGLTQYSIPVAYKIVTYKLLNQEALTKPLFAGMINQEFNLLTYELLQQFYHQTGLPPQRFDAGGQSITKVYQDLYYVWLNQMRKMPLSIPKPA